MKKAVDKVPETRQNTVNRIMPRINVSGDWQRKMLTVNFKKAVSIKLTAFLAFSVFCSVEVFIYIFLRKKTKFRTFLNSL